MAVVNLTLLLLLLGLRVLGSPIPGGPLVGWQSEPMTRGTFSIITSCGVTLGLCVWSAIHPDVMPNSTRRQRFFKKVTWALKALLIPEEVLSEAADQWVQTRRLHRALVYRSFLATYDQNQTFASSRGPAPAIQVQFRPAAYVEAIQGIPTSAELDHASKITPPVMTEDDLPNKATSTIRESQENSLKPSKIKAWFKETFGKPAQHFFRECGHGVDKDSFAKEVVFFVVMGGFIRPGEEKPIAPEEFLEAFINDPKGLLAKVNPNDILDKGKASLLAKLIVCGQVGWLVLQLIGRQVAKLPIALLELHVLIHVIVAAAVYAFWWNKQLDVQEPIVLDIPAWPLYKRRDPYWYKRPDELRSDGFRGFVERWWLLPPQWSGLSIPEVDSERRRREMMVAAAAQHGPTTPPNDPSGLKRNKTLFKRPTVLQKKRKSDPVTPTSNTLLSTTPSIPDTEISSTQFVLPIQPPTDENYDAIKDAELSARLSERQTLRGNLTACTFYFIYAGLHATAWKARFPTRYERWIWRGSCLVVGIVPAMLVLLSTVQMLVGRRMRKRQELRERFEIRNLKAALRKKEFHQKRIQSVLEYSLQAVYLCASTCLLAMSFESLRSMPEKAYDTVPWSTYIPHV